MPKPRNLTKPRKVQRKVGGFLRTDPRVVEVELGKGFTVYPNRRFCSDIYQLRAWGLRGTKSGISEREADRKKLLSLLHQHDVMLDSQHRIIHSDGSLLTDTEASQIFKALKQWEERYAPRQRRRNKKTIKKETEA